MAADEVTIWSRVQALCWVPVLALGAITDSVTWPPWRLVLAILVLGSVVSLTLVLRTYRRLPDIVTLSRGLGLAALLGMASTNPWFAWAVAVTVAALDLVDGALARRVGPTGAGAVQDMETDQLLVTTFALLIANAGGAPHVLLLPLMRPAFVLAAWQAGLPANDPKPVDGDNRRGKLVCAAVVVALLVAMLPGVANWLRDAVTGAAVLLLLWSFSSDWRFLWSRRRPGESVDARR